MRVYKNQEKEKESVIYKDNINKKANKQINYVLFTAQNLMHN